MDEAIREMRRAGIIERSSSEYCNPIRIVIKSDHSVRICLDARYINAILESDHESPPLVSELIQKFHGVSFFSITDLESGYCQIPLNDESRKYTAFLYDFQMYQFYRLTFGIKTAGSAFIRSLNLAIGNQLNDILTIYVDDLLIATSGSFYDHLRGFERVFSLLQEKGFTLKLNKSLFCRREVRFLGYELSVNGVKPLQDKLEVILQFSKPKNRRELQQFIGVCTYYRQFTLKHSDLVGPFRDLLKERNPWVWNECHDSAFENMKRAFVDCIRLLHYLPNKPYHLQTDATDVRVSGVLYQIDDSGHFRVVSLVSRCLNVAESYI